MGLDHSDSDSDGGDKFCDPFARLNSNHPSIKESRQVASDTFVELFDDIFEYMAFVRWMDHRHSWQLHCIGGPGAGKTTFALLTTERIRRSGQKLGAHVVHVASIFIGDEPIDNDLIFLEDFLHSIYRQLTRSALPTSHATARLYEKYAHACDEGRRVSIRTDCLRRGLHQRLTDIQSNETAFLVLDNVDHCNPSLRELLEREIAQLQQLGLKIMVTTRNLRNGRQQRSSCDLHRGGWIKFEAFWHCSNCNKKDICLECYEQSLPCPNCGTNTIWEEPEYKELYLDSISGPSISKYVAWDLEREHGDLGLGSSVDRKPPLSQFGMAFVKTDYGLDWVHQVAASCENSVVVTKLALDRIHDLSSPEDFELNPKRLPSNLQAIFKNVINKITQDTNPQRTVALKAMAAVGKLGTIQGPGVPLSKLVTLLKDRSSHLVPPRSFEDILDASRGLLRLAAPRDETEKFSIVACSPRWHLYMSDDYNDDIWMANTMLPVSNLPRHSTVALPKREPFEEFLEKRLGLPSPDPAPASRTTSPPLEREAFTFARSRTYMVPVPPEATSPSLGLGLTLGFNIPKKGHEL